MWGPPVYVKIGGYKFFKVTWPRFFFEGMRGQVKCNIESVLEWGRFKWLASHKPIWIKCTILKSSIQEDDFVSIVISLGALSQFCNGYMGINCHYIGKERNSSFLVVNMSNQKLKVS